MSVPHYRTNNSIRYEAFDEYKSKLMVAQQANGNREMPPNVTLKPCFSTKTDNLYCNK